jgi:hypothetical protein
LAPCHLEKGPPPDRRIRNVSIHGALAGPLPSSCCPVPHHPSQMDRATHGNTNKYPLNILFSDLGAGAREFESPHPDSMLGARHGRQVTDSAVPNIS